MPWQVSPQVYSRQWGAAIQRAVRPPSPPPWISTVDYHINCMGNHSGSPSPPATLHTSSGAVLAGQARPLPTPLYGGHPTVLHCGRSYSSPVFVQTALISYRLAFPIHHRLSGLLCRHPKHQRSPRHQKSPRNRNRRAAPRCAGHHHSLDIHCGLPYKLYG